MPGAYGFTMGTAWAIGCGLAFAALLGHINSDSPNPRTLQLEDISPMVPMSVGPSPEEASGTPARDRRMVTSAKTRATKQTHSRPPYSTYKPHANPGYSPLGTCHGGINLFGSLF